MTLLSDYGGNDGFSGELLEVDNNVLLREGLTMKGEVTYMQVFLG